MPVLQNYFEEKKWIIITVYIRLTKTYVITPHILYKWL